MTIFASGGFELLQNVLESDIGRYAVRRLSVTTRNFLLNLRSLLYTYHKH